MMNNPTSYELCKELYDLSGWKTDHEAHYVVQKDGTLRLTNAFDPEATGTMYIYTLEYLLDKLPSVRLETWHDGHVVMKWFPDGVVSKLEKMRRGVKVEADTAKSAAIKLCLELIKQEIIPGRNG